MVPAGREKLAHKHENTCLSILNWGSRKNVYFSVRLTMGGTVDKKGGEGDHTLSHLSSRYC